MKYPWNSDLIITTSQGVINLSRIYSLNSAIPSFRNRIYSGDKGIPEIEVGIPGIELFLLSGTGHRKIMKEGL